MITANITLPLLSVNWRENTSIKIPLYVRRALKMIDPVRASIRVGMLSLLVNIFNCFTNSE